MTDLKAHVCSDRELCSGGKILRENPEFERGLHVRQLPPAHCTLKIESFSLLQETLARTKTEKIVSVEFITGGYTWVLSMYPKGNEKENGEGHVSLYVRLVEKLNVGTFVSVIIRFLVYDQTQDNYLVIQDLKERRFQPMKMEWGISRAVELSTFHDTSKGFVINDCCILGAEVLVIKSDNKGTACLSMVKPQTIRKYTWKVTELMKELLFSPNFSIEDRQWRLSLWPKGYGRETWKNLSLYLWLNDNSALTAGRTLYAEFELCIKNQLKGDDHREIVGGWFSSTNKCWGLTNFLPLTDLENPSKGFKLNEAVIVEVNINLIFLLKDV